MAEAISKDGTVIYYEMAGTGPVIILVDGALSYTGYRGGRPLAVELSDQFTVVIYDRRGRGKSADQQPYSAVKEMEDIDALINKIGTPVFMFGFSSGAVLALRAAAWNNKIQKLVLLEPPFGENSEAAEAEFASYTGEMKKLVDEGKNSDAVSFFLADMLPPEVLEGIKELPDWKLMESVAHTLVYDNEVMGNGAVPVNITPSIRIPALVLVGGESPGFKHTAAMELVEALPAGEFKILEGESTLVPPEVLAPVLKDFFGK